MTDYLKLYKKYKDNPNVTYKLCQGWDSFIDRWVKHAEMCFDWMFDDPLVSEAKIYVAIEGYAFAAKGQVFNIAEATGVLKYYLHYGEIPFIIYQPGEVKKFFTGKGNAKKPEMRERLEVDFNVNLDEYFGMKDDASPSADLVDAFAIMLMLRNNLSLGINTDKDFIKGVKNDD